MGAPSDITQVLGNTSPALPVAFFRAGDGVGDFVEEHLVDLIILGGLSEVPRDGDAFFLMIALAKAGLGVVEIKTPRRIQMEANQCIGPDSDSVLLGHGHRLALRVQATGEISPALSLLGEERFGQGGRDQGVGVDLGGHPRDEALKFRSRQRAGGVGAESNHL